MLQIVKTRWGRRQRHGAATCRTISHHRPSHHQRQWAEVWDQNVDTGPLSEHPTRRRTQTRQILR